MKPVRFSRGTPGNTSPNELDLLQLLEINSLLLANLLALSQYFSYTHLHMLNSGSLGKIHVGSAENFKSKGNIPGYHLIGSTHDRAYDVARYVRSKIATASMSWACTNNNNCEDIIKMNEITIFIVCLPSLLKEDFNSHHQLWSYLINVTYDVIPIE